MPIVDIKDTVNIQSSLWDSISIFKNFIASIPPEDLEVIRKPDYWSIRDHINHIASVQPMLYQRLSRFLDEESPVFTPYFPAESESFENLNTMDLEQIMEIYQNGRGDQLSILKDYTAEIWQRRGTHPEYKLYTPYILVRHILMHDHWHMYRMEELWLTTDEYLK